MLISIVLTMVVIIPELLMTKCFCIVSEHALILTTVDILMHCPLLIYTQTEITGLITNGMIRYICTWLRLLGAVIATQNR